MNGTGAALVEIERLGALLGGTVPAGCEALICPPATLLSRLAEKALPLGIAVGGQDCHTMPGGAHTGDISAQMLADCGARYVILGHSERRQNHGESDDLVCRKAEAALAAGLTPVVCVGETEAERDAGRALAVVGEQVEASVPADWSSLVVAYEPVWAIGTGRTPSSHEIAEMHAAIRALLVSRFGERGAGVRILYGGSMKPANAAEILAISHVNGGLVGGASLLAKDFHAIISAV